MSTPIRTHTDYADQVFRELHLEDVQLVSCEFLDCTFIRCSFAQGIFRSCRFINCIFKQCDWSLARVPDCVFSGTCFVDSKVVGVNWTEADWSAIRLRLPIAFSACALSHSTFIGLSLREVKIRDCVAVDVDFREADLTRADLRRTDLSKSLFSDTNLTKADLRRARNYDIDPAQNVLREAVFSFPEAISLLHGMDIRLAEEDEDPEH